MALYVIFSSEFRFKFTLSVSEQPLINENKLKVSGTTDIFIPRKTYYNYILEKCCNESLFKGIFVPKTKSIHLFLHFFLCILDGFKSTQCQMPPHPPPPWLGHQALGARGLPVAPRGL
jgi:hypothetical protein